MPERKRRRDGGEDLAYAILRSVRRILRRVALHSRALARGSGLTVPQLLSLRAVEEISREGPATSAEVSRRLQLSAPTVCHIVDRLEKSGLLRRERDARDRRRITLLLTDAGRAALARRPTPLQEQFLLRLRALPAAEQRDLLAALDRIVGMMEAGDLDAAPILAPEGVLRRGRKR